MCLLSPECVQTKYMLPVLVHVVALPGHTTIGSGSNISITQIQNAILTLNKQFSAFGISHPSSVNTGIQFYLAPVGPQSNGVFRYNDTLSNNQVFSFSNLRSLVHSDFNNNPLYD